MEKQPKNSPRRSWRTIYGWLRAWPNAMGRRIPSVFYGAFVQTKEGDLGEQLVCEAACPEFRPKGKHAGA